MTTLSIVVNNTMTLECKIVEIGTQDHRLFYKRNNEVGWWEVFTSFQDVRKALSHFYTIVSELVIK